MGWVCAQGLGESREMKVADYVTGTVVVVGCGERGEVAMLDMIGSCWLIVLPVFCCCEGCVKMRRCVDDGD